MARRRSRQQVEAEQSYGEIGREIYGRLARVKARTPWDGLDWEPLTLGPTWRRTPAGRWDLPKLTLGWDALGWCSRWLQLDPDTPWRFTDEQARWMLHWYAIEPDGRFVDREGVLQRLKGWGKDPLGACLCAVEMLGPCRFSDFDKRQPIAVDVADAWVQTAAVSLEQTKNTMRLFPTLFTEEASAHYGIIVGKEKIYALGDRRLIEAVTSSPKSLQGNRGTFSLLNETHEWTEANDGVAMWQAVQDNLTKAADASSRSLAITNAYDPGEGTVAQEAREAYERELAGEVVPLGVMYDSLEAPASVELTEAAIAEAVPVLRGDSVWLTPERIIARVHDPRNPPSRSRRYWLNQVTASEDAVFSPQEWDGAAAPATTVDPGTMVTLGLDPSESNDHTALIGCTVEGDHLFDIEFWRPDPKTGLIDRAGVDRAVRAAFELYDVVGFYSDVHPFEAELDRWAEEFGGAPPRTGLCVRASQRHPIAWDMRGVGVDGGQRQRMFSEATARFVAAIIESSTGASEVRLTHDGSPRFRRHVLNAYRKPTKWGFTVRKESRDSQKKIDALPAAILARLARLDYLALPKSRRRKVRTGVVW